MNITIDAKGTTPTTTTTTTTTTSTTTTTTTGSTTTPPTDAPPSTRRRLNYMDTATQQVLHSLTVVETFIDTTDTDSTGLHIWPSSIHLGAALVAMGKQGDLQGLRVLELGAGTGVAGCVAGHLDYGAASILFTDVDPMVLKALETNIQQQHRCSLVAHAVAELEWGNLHHVNAVLSKCNSGLDLILGADCLYNRDQWDSFLATVYFLLAAASKQRKRDAKRKSEGGGGSGVLSYGSTVAKPPRFVGCHQLRNSNHTIQPLLNKWGLIGQELRPTTAVHARDVEVRETLGLYEITLKE